MTKPMVRVGIVCDLKEERWPSMDLVGDMLCQQFAGERIPGVQASRLQPSLRRNFTALPLGGRSRFAWNADRILNRAVYYPIWLRRRRKQFDVVHILDHSYAQLAWQTDPARTIVTCHDLEAFSCLQDEPPQRSSRWFESYSRHVLGGLRRAAHVIFVTQTVRNAAIANGWVEAGRTSVVHNGVDPGYGAEPQAECDVQAARLLPFDAGVPLLLHVGSTVKRKRIDILLNVFASIRKFYPQAKLVRVGGPFTSEQAERAVALGVLRDIVELPFLDRGVLAAVYRRCDVVLLPSEVEGFGLPVIEAMACGCPVVATDHPVLREVGGAAAVFVPLEDIAAWRDAVMPLLRENERNSDARSRRRKACLLHSRRFSWGAAATQLASLYQNTAGQGKRY